MHQRSSHCASPARARRILGATSLAALAYLSGCNGDAYNLGEDEPAVEEEGTCNIDPGTSESIFTLDRANVEVLRGCRELPGNLYIRLPAEERETFSLEPLSQLEVVHGVLSIVGPFESLEGLESLEQVSSLELQGLLVPDLTAFRGLRRVMGELSQLRTGGLIKIADCDGITDLTGLDNVTSWSSLSLSGVDNLESLSGLQTPARVEQVELYAPRLADVSALGTMNQVGMLNIGGTAIEHLDLRSLNQADFIYLFNNWALTDLDGLRKLRVVGSLGINDNDALQRVQLPSLTSYQGISIIGNAVLEAVPAYRIHSGAASLSASGSFDTGEVLSSGQLLFEVGDNPLVESITMPTSFPDIGQVAIYQNPSLTSLDMGGLQRSNNIWIEDNAVLDALSATLQRVGDLSVKNNPALSVAPFANVQTFTREITGNLDELAP